MIKIESLLRMKKKMSVLRVSVRVSVYPFAEEDSSAGFRLAYYKKDKSTAVCMCYHVLYTRTSNNNNYN